MTYHEVQRLELVVPMLIVMVLIAGLAAWGWRVIPLHYRAFYYFVLSLPLILIAILHLLFKIDVRVTNEKLSIDARPFGGEVIPIDDIESAEEIEYEPQHDFGGWGIRSGLGGKIYSANGNKAIKVTLRSNKIIFIGTKHPDRLLSSIKRKR